MSQSQFSNHDSITGQLGRDSLPRDILRFAVTHFPNHVAIVSPRGSYTYHELAERVFRLVAGLKSIGIDSGCHIFTHLNDSLEQIEVRLAAYELGATISAFNPGHTNPQIINAGRLVKPDAFIFDPLISSSPAKFFRGNLPSTRLIMAGPGSSYEQLIAGSEPMISEIPIDPGTPAALRFSFENDSRPVAMHFSHSVIMAGVLQTMSELGFSWSDENDIVLLGVPLSNGGEDVVLPALASSDILVLPETYGMKSILALIPQYQISRLYITSSQLIDFLDYTEAGQYDVSPLRNVIYGNAAIPPAKLEEAIRRYGTIFHQIYRLQECQSVISCLRVEDHFREGTTVARRVLRSVGKPAGQIHVRIIDGNKNEQPLGKAGEIMVSAPTMCDGYLRRPDLTARLTRDGYVSTGDIGYIDKQGLLHVFNRRRDVFRRDERWIYPKLIEDILHRHPAIKETCLVRDENGSKLTLCVSLRESWRERMAWSRMSGKLWDYLASRLDDAQMPDALVYIGELPRSYSGKVLRNDVQALLKRKKNQRSIPSFIFNNGKTPPLAGPVH